MLGPAGRPTGINKYWVNIQRPDDSMCSINLQQSKQWKETEHNETVFLLDNNDQKVSQAKAKELRKWSEHNVYAEVDNEGQDYITTQWVITEKFIDNNRTAKARLFARGFEEEHLSTLRKDSLTCGKKIYGYFLPLQCL